jgi:hypothetical protein
MTRHFTIMTASAALSLLALFHFWGQEAAQTRCEQHHSFETCFRALR